MNVDTGERYPSREYALKMGVPADKLVEVEGDEAAVGRLQENLQKAAKSRSAMTGDELDRAFTYHPPTDGQRVRYTEIRARAYDLAQWIRDFCPNSREKSLALTKLREAVMWANASIACNE